jgi:hypothetical protein
MNIVTSSTWPDSPVQPTASRPSPDRESGAFQQTLRVMEKDMWPGAESGNTTGYRSPSTTAPRQGPARDHVHVTFDTANNTRASTNAFDPCSKPPAGKLALLVVEDSSSPASSDTASRSPRQGPPARILECLAPYTHLVRAPVVEQCETRAPSTEAVAPAPARGSVNALTVPSNTDGAAPYRLNVIVEAGRVSIALRVDGMTPDDLDTLKQKALEQARRHGARDVRLVMNGVEQLPTLLPGSTHGH